MLDGGDVRCPGAIDTFWLETLHNSVVLRLVRNLSLSLSLQVGVMGEVQGYDKLKNSQCQQFHMRMNASDRNLWQSLYAHGSPIKVQTQRFVKWLYRGAPFQSVIAPPMTLLCAYLDVKHFAQHTQHMQILCWKLCLWQELVGEYRSGPNAIAIIKLPTSFTWQNQIPRLKVGICYEIVQIWLEWPNHFRYTQDQIMSNLCVVRVQ